MPTAVAVTRRSTKFVHIQDKLKLAATKRQSYKQVLVDPDTAATAVDPPVAQIVIGQTVDEFKLDIKTSIAEFTSQFTTDIDKIICEYSKELKRIKTAIVDATEKYEKAIESVRKENLELSSKLATLEVKLNECEKGVDQVSDLQGKFLNRFPDDLNNVNRYIVDCIKLLFVKFGKTLKIQDRLKIWKN